MSRYGKDLESSFMERDYKVSKESVFSLGFKLINIIEQVHEAGLIYNDLKLANVLVGYGEKLPKDCTKGNCLKDLPINLVDFGMISKYADRKTGEHLPPKNLDCFYGNLLFSSAHHLSFNRTSRRDDLFAIFSIMVYLLNEGEIPEVPWE